MGKRLNIIYFVVWILLISILDSGVALIIWLYSNRDFYFRGWDGVKLTILWNSLYWILFCSLTFYLTAFINKRRWNQIWTGGIEEKFVLYSLLWILIGFNIIHFIEFKIKTVLYGVCCSILLFIVSLIAFINKRRCNEVWTGGIGGKFVLYSLLWILIGFIIIHFIEFKIERVLYGACSILVFIVSVAVQRFPDAQNGNKIDKKE